MTFRPSDDLLRAGHKLADHLIAEEGERDMTGHYIRITEDRHQEALYRLALVQQYLYDTMNGGGQRTGRGTPDPLPVLSMDQVREVQRLIDLAIKYGQRTRRECLGGHLELDERRGPSANPPSTSA